ncbi:unnamed protein product [Eruca vesicaria subsp. sativa]|uniref:Late embryogenesis abundant protein LEA-2 subgroup domain-containing protein n=1 Tax=Eruca vesicaria subsp. sativa TaxID=29727 RepID=A0ABC8IV80_ERUVS|nr:unnamed protein product [Eruca vesicaria subsp. sativa]
MGKGQAKTKKTEAKEEGVTFRVSYEDIQGKRNMKIVFYAFVAFVLLGLGLIGIFHLIKPPVPLFMLDDLSVDQVSNSSVVVTLSSNNPSHTTNIYYSEVSVGVQIKGIFRSDSVNLQSTLQETRERTPWTTVVAINNGNNVNTNGSLGIIDGLMKNGDVVAHVKILGKFGILKNSLLYTCPIMTAKSSIPCQVI